MTSRRPDPLALLGLALALLGGTTYLWLVQQKGDGRFEPAWWFVGLIALGCVEVGYGALLEGRARQVAVASGGALLVVTAGLSPLAMETSHTAALLGSVGLLVSAGGVAAILAARPWFPPRGLVAAGAVAVLVVAVALPTAWSLASRGEGVGGDSSAG
jgi:hypothetical protein